MFARIRTVILIGLLLVTLGGVFQAAAQTEDNKAVVERWVELWNTGNLAIADEILAADFVNHHPYYPNVTDLESLKAWIGELLAAFPDLHVTVHDLVAEGDIVVKHYTSTFGPIVCTGMDFIRLADGKIVEMWWVLDMLGYLQQIGHIDPMGRVDFTWGTPSEVTGDPGDPETNREPFEHGCTEALNNQNLAALDENVATNVVFHDPVIGDIIGIEGYKQMFAMYFAAFPDLHVTVHDIIAEGDKVAARWTATATHEGEFMGIPPTGVQISIPAMVIHRFADAKSVEIWFVADNLGLLQQLGVIPPLGPTAVESSTWGQVKSLFQE